MKMTIAYTLLLVLGLSLGPACSVVKREQKDSVTARQDELLLGTWMVSHEEDGKAPAGARIWRNTKFFKFPPARGREGITFLPDGKCIFLAIAPTDGTEEQPGRYGWGGKDHLKVTLENGRLITFKIQELTAEKMVAKQE